MSAHQLPLLTNGAQRIVLEAMVGEKRQGSKNPSMGCDGRMIETSSFACHRPSSTMAGSLRNRMMVPAMGAREGEQWVFAGETIIIKTMTAKPMSPSSTL